MHSYFQNVPPVPPPIPTWDQLQARTSKPLVKPQWVVRPIPIEISRADAGLDDGEGVFKNRQKPAHMCGLVLLCIYKYLPVNDLLSCMRVCREWARWSIHHSLWQHITLPPEEPLSDSQLEGIVRRQPRRLTLSWVKLTFDELMWLLMRLPQMSELDVEGLDWDEVRALATCYAPPLRKLNAGFVNGIDNDTIRELLSPSIIQRPGFRNVKRARLLQITHLSIARSHVSDEGIKFLCTELKLIHLDISSCYMIDNNCVEIIADHLHETLESLDTRGCCGLTVMVLPQLARLKLLSNLGIGYNPLIPSGALRAWTNTFGYKEKEDGFYERVPPSVRQAKLAMQSRLVKFAFQEILKSHAEKLRQHQKSYSNMSPSAFKKPEQGCDGKQAEEPKPSTSQSKKSYSTKEKENLPESSSADIESESVTTQSKSPGKKQSTAALETKKRSPSKDKAKPSKLQADQRDTISKKSNPSKENKASKEIKRSSSRASTVTEDSNVDTSPSRSRRRPSRFAETEIEFNPPLKQSKKKMKQVTVELEDINITQKFGGRRPASASKKKDGGISSDSPKTRKGAGINIKASKPNLYTEVETSESDVSLASISTLEENQQSPRRAQRRSRDISEDGKEIVTSKEKANSAKKPKISPDVNRTTKVDAAKNSAKKNSPDDKFTRKVKPSNIKSKFHKKEKDIMTRSKRLKQEPIKALRSDSQSMSTDIKSPRVMICRKEVDKSIKAKVTVETSKKKLKFPDTVKRSKSASDINHGQQQKSSQDAESVYSAKLRKKSLDGNALVAESSLSDDKTDVKFSGNTKPDSKNSCNEESLLTPEPNKCEQLGASPQRSTRRKCDTVDTPPKESSGSCSRVKTLSDKRGTMAKAELKQTNDDMNSFKSTDCDAAQMRKDDDVSKEKRTGSVDVKQISSEIKLEIKNDHKSDPRMKEKQKRDGEKVHCKMIIRRESSESSSVKSIKHEVPGYTKDSDNKKVSKSPKQSPKLKISKTSKLKLKIIDQSITEPVYSDASEKEESSKSVRKQSTSGTVRKSGDNTKSTTHSDSKRTVNLAKSSEQDSQLKTKNEQELDAASRSHLSDDIPQEDRNIDDKNTSPTAKGKISVSNSVSGLSNPETIAKPQCASDYKDNNKSKNSIFKSTESSSSISDIKGGNNDISGDVLKQETGGEYVQKPENMNPEFENTDQIPGEHHEIKSRGNLQRRRSTESDLAVVEKDTHESVKKAIVRRRSSENLDINKAKSSAPTGRKETSEPTGNTDNAATVRGSKDSILPKQEKKSEIKAKGTKNQSPSPSKVGVHRRDSPVGTEKKKKKHHDITKTSGSVKGKSTDGNECTTQKDKTPIKVLEDVQSLTSNQSVDYKKLDSVGRSVDEEISDDKINDSLRKNEFPTETRETRNPDEEGKAISKLKISVKSSNLTKTENAETKPREGTNVVASTECSSNKEEKEIPSTTTSSESKASFKPVAEILIKDKCESEPRALLILQKSSLNFHA